MNVLGLTPRQITIRPHSVEFRLGDIDWLLLEFEEGYFIEGNLDGLFAAPIAEAEDVFENLQHVFQLRAGSGEVRFYSHLPATVRIILNGVPNDV